MENLLKAIYKLRLTKDQVKERPLYAYGFTDALNAVVELITRSRNREQKEKVNMIYLAIPYTWNPERSFEIANQVAAELMLMGYVVFSPVSHSHPISLHMTKEKQIEHDFWMKQDLPMLLKADKMVIIDIGQPLIQNSKGLQKEIQTARENNIPIAYYRYSTSDWYGNDL